MTVPTVEPTIRVLSLGAGVQSTTLALLAVEGALPKPDAAIFADTGWEPQAVYDHLARLASVLTATGVALHRVSAGNLRDDAINPTHRYASVPYFVRNPDGSEGMGRRQCTSEYKLAPICPYHGNRQWREMRDQRPAEWADAVEFDQAIRKGGARGLPLNGEAFLHRSRVPLELAPIDRVTSREWHDRQTNLIDQIADHEAGYDPGEDGDPDGCSPYGCRSGVPTTEVGAA